MGQEENTLGHGGNYKIDQGRILPDIIRDGFSHARGGTPDLLSLSCTNCHTEVMIYQKDGRGDLIRCYFDRIYFPDELPHPMRLPYDQPVSKLPNLYCSSCHTPIGTPMIFKKENRLAYRIIRGSIAKKKLK